jgi:hypothetical protein
MFALLEIVVVVAAAAIVGSFLMRTRRGNDRASILERRVEAYMQTIRREASNPGLAAMSDTELRDLLLSSARNLRIEAERRTYILAGVGAVGVIAAIVVSSQQGIEGFAITLVIAAIVVYGLFEYLGRRMQGPLLRQGIDVERLRVE